MTNDNWGQYISAKEQLLGIAQKEYSAFQMIPRIRVRNVWKRAEVDLFFEALQVRKAERCSYTRMAEWMNNEA
jgi:hypothetical protein